MTHSSVCNIENFLTACLSLSVVLLLAMVRAVVQEMFDDQFMIYLKDLKGLVSSLNFVIMYCTLHMISQTYIKTM